MNPLDFILHVNEHLLQMVALYGTWVYAVIFLIVFVETGLIVMPFLPGDSLLFTVGAIAATGSLDPWVGSGIIIVAAFCGDNTNYWVGRLIGKKLFSNPNSKLFRQSHLKKTEQFYETYGSRAVILARFMPIVRSFAPFVAGIGKMPYLRYITFSCIGSALWVTVCLGTGYAFGNMEIVKKNFELVVLGVIAVSMLPIAFEVLKRKYTKLNIENPPVA